MNLIAVNWEKSSQTLNYIAARNRVEAIGAHVAALIDTMVFNELVNINDITVIGFSLGAHVAGIGNLWRLDSDFFEVCSNINDICILFQLANMCSRASFQKSSAWIRLALFLITISHTHDSTVSMQSNNSQKN